MPGDPAAVNELLTWLATEGVDYAHPPFMRPATPLNIETPDGTRTARPGDWVVQLELYGFTVMSDALFTSLFETYPGQT
jgi:hypothetical protein